MRRTLSTAAPERFGQSHVFGSRVLCQIVTPGAAARFARSRGELEQGGGLVLADTDRVVSLPWIGELWGIGSAAEVETEVVFIP